VLRETQLEPEQDALVSRQEDVDMHHAQAPLLAPETQVLHDAPNKAQLGCNDGVDEGVGDQVGVGEGVREGVPTGHCAGRPLTSDAEHTVALSRPDRPKHFEVEAHQ
jgi:hypothetical protein